MKINPTAVPINVEKVISDEDMFQSNLPVAVEFQAFRKSNGEVMSIVFGIKFFGVFVRRVQKNIESFTHGRLVFGDNLYVCGCSECEISYSVGIDID